MAEVKVLVFASSPLTLLSWTNLQSGRDINSYTCNCCHFVPLPVPLAVWLSTLKTLRNSKYLMVKRAKPALDLGQKKVKGEKHYAWEQRSSQPVAVETESLKTFAWEHPERVGLPNPAALAEVENGPGEELDPGTQLVDVLLTAHLAGQITAKLLVAIAYWAHQAGVEACASLSLEPEKLAEGGGNAKKRVDRFLARERKSKLPFPPYSLKMPALLSGTHERGTYDLKMLSPHCLVDTLPSDIKSHMEKEFLQHKHALPPSYHSHPLVVANPSEHIVPYSLFVDGVQYNRKANNLIGFTISPICGGPRFVIATVRKRLLCNCGCRGWCSLYRIFAALRWSFECAARGKHPDKDMDGQEFEELGYKEVAGKQLSKFLVLQLKIDWGEVPTFGLPTWKSANHPCVFCAVNHEQFLDMTPYNNGGLLDLHLPLKTIGDYKDACESSEIWLEDLSEEEHAAICGLLELDCKKQGHHGLVMSTAYPPRSLKKGDRIEPCCDHHDWRMVLDGRPKRLHFWRDSCQRLTHHRNPLFDSNILCMDPYSSYVIDLMHTFFLGPGVYGQVVTSALWAVLDADIFGFKRRSKEASHKATLDRLDKEFLLPFYGLYKGSKTLSRVDKLVIEMLGSSDQPALHTKASQTLWLVRWLCNEEYGLKQFPAFHHQEMWVEALGTLLHLYNRLKEGSFTLPDAIIEDAT
eukprot:6482102-Amphidinium_carterae.2